MAPAQIDAAAKQLVERYRLVDLIGRGGFGEVWKAYDNVRKEYVAIKGPRSDHSLTAGLVRSFLREAEKAMQLADSQVVPVREVVESPTQRQGELICFIVMKLMDGGSLAGRLTGDERPSVRQSVRWIAELADTLAEIHAHGYIHRDIKPDNILFDENDRPCFSDFGLAASASEQLGEARRVMGTVTYMAPEQARKQHVDRQADIYSLGVVLYQLLALPHVRERRLALPYLARDSEEYFEALGDPNQHPRTLPQQVPQALADIVEDHCVCDDKTRRYRLATDLSRDLRAWLRASGKKNLRRTILRFVLPIALAGLVVAAFLMVRSWYPPVEPEPPPNGGIGPEEPGGAGGTPRVLTVGDWNKLLDRPLKKRRWPGPETHSETLEDFELEELTVVIDGDALLEAGEVTREDFVLRLRLIQPAWNGGVGVFYGLKRRDDGYECERIQLLRWPDPLGSPTFRLDRDYLTLDQEFFPVHREGRSTAAIPMPKGEQELTIVCKDGSLESVSWGAEELDELTEDTRPDSPPLDCRGGFGLYIERGTLTVSQFRIFLDEGAPDDE